MATPNQVRSAMHAAHFRPFAVRLADGSHFTVKHPDFISLAVNGLELVIHDDDGLHWIDMDLVTEVHRPPQPAERPASESNGT
jgi:hypothetical protein